MAALPKWPRRAAWSAVGYLGLFVLLYLGYQAYYGNVWRCADVVVAQRISDWALIGAVLALVVTWPSNATQVNAQSETSWIVLWFLLFLTIALSAFGQGWFIRLNPQRLMVFLGLPMAILAAKALERIGKSRLRVANTLMAAIVVCGMCSTVVGALFFQGPLGRQPGKGPFAYRHYELMTPADAELLNHLEGGTVLPPPWSPIAFGEIIAQRPGMAVLGGPGAMNISDQLFSHLQGEIGTFWKAETPNSVRRDFALDWELDYIFCPATCPVEPGILNQFRDAPWLREVIALDRAVLFKVFVRKLVANGDELTDKDV